MRLIGPPKKINWSEILMGITTDSNKLYKLSLWTITFACVLVVIFHGPQMGRDTLDYLSGTILRPPLPCLLFDLFRLVLGSKYATGYLLFQTAAVLWACYYFTETLRHTAKTGNLFAVAIFAIAVSPIVNGWITCYLLSEAVSYSLFLISFALLAQLLETLNNKKLFILAVVIVINMLNRPQMVFAYGMYVPAVFYLFIHQKRFMKSILPVMLWVVAPMLIYVTAECGYNLIRHGHFSRSDFTGQNQVAAYLLYLSNKDDLNLFSGKQYYPAMERIYSEMDTFRLFAKYRHDADMNYAAYVDSGIRPIGIYNATSARCDIIYWHTLVRNLYTHESGMNVSRKEWMEASVIDYAGSGKWIAIRNIAIDITHTLFQHHWLDYIKLMGSKLKNYLPPYALVLVLLLSSMPLLREGHTTEFMSFSAIFSALNLLLLSSCVSLIPRLTFYTDILLFECSLLFACELYKTGRGQPTYSSTSPCDPLSKEATQG